MHYIRYTNPIYWAENSSNGDGVTLEPVPPAILNLTTSDESTIIHSTNNVSQWNDISGNNRNFIETTVNNQPQYLPNAIGNRAAIDFDGVNDILQYPVTNPSWFNNLEKQTFFIVTKLPSVNPVQDDCIFGATRFNGYNFVLLTPNRSIRYQVSSGTAGTQKSIFSSQTYNLNEYIIITTDIAGTPAGNGDMRIFVNNSLVADSSFLDKVGPNSGASRVAAGAVRNASAGGVRHYAGQLFDILIFDTVLSDSQRLQVYESLLLNLYGPSRLPQNVPSIKSHFETSYAGVPENEVVTLDGSNNIEEMLPLSNTLPKISQTNLSFRPAFQTSILNGLPGALFSSTSTTYLESLNQIIGFSNTLSFYMVAQRTINNPAMEPAGTVSLWKPGETNDSDNIESVSFNCGPAGLPLLGYVRNNGTNAVTHPALNDAFIYSSIFNGTSNSSFLNGVGTGFNNPTATTGNFDIENIRVGARQVGGLPGDFYDGYVFAIIVADVEHTAAERTLVENYLLLKYFSTELLLNEYGQNLLTEDGAYLII